MNLWFIFLYYWSRKKRQSNSRKRLSIRKLRMKFLSLSEIQYQEYCCDVICDWHVTDETSCMTGYITLVICITGEAAKVLIGSPPTLSPLVRNCTLFSLFRKFKWYKGPTMMVTTQALRGNTRGARWRQLEISILWYQICTQRINQAHQQHLVTTNDVSWQIKITNFR